MDSTLLAHIDVGVIMVDALGFITCANEQAASLLGISFTFLEPGSDYADLKQKMMVRTTLATNDAGFSYGPKVWQDDRSNPQRCDLHLTNGTIVELRSNALPDGGFIHTLTDVGHDRLLRAKLHRMATTDPLTGVANRRHFRHRCQHEIDRANRYSSNLALLILDLDHFKAVNDQYGHAVGDAVLTSLSTTSMASIRTIDLFGRLGGEEFGVLLPETGIETAAIVAERLRQAVAACPVKVTQDTTVFVTVSIGISIVKPDDENPDSLLARADDALYRAKNLGRNRIEILK